MSLKLSVVVCEPLLLRYAEIESSDAANTMGYCDAGDVLLVSCWFMFIVIVAWTVQTSPRVMLAVVAPFELPSK